MIALLTTSLQLSTTLLTLRVHRQNKLKNIIVILVSKENCIKNQLFLRQQRKTTLREEILAGRKFGGFGGFDENLPN